MQAIILAAGMGKRLKELTANNTKCMVKVNGVTLIDRMLHQIDSHDFSRIVIVVGYEGQKLIDYISTLKVKTPIQFINNPIYDKTNNIYSLALAKDELCEDDTILFESDLIFEDKVLDSLIDDSRQTLALVDKYESWMNGTCVKINNDDSVKAFVPGKEFNFKEKDEYYKTVNIYKFSKEFSQSHYVPFLEAYQKALGLNEYYEQVLRVITTIDNSELRVKRLNGELWYEIDDIQDLDIAESMFIPDEDKRVDMLLGRYGGYWRYPKLVDFCYLVNPYFPPQKMLDEIGASIGSLITQYPSGMRVNSLLAAKNFGIKQDQILVGNGATELIKALMTQFSGKLGIVRPTFEEYSHRYDAKDIVCYWPENNDFRYDEKDLIRFFDDKEIKNLILINPDNPSGNFISKSGLLKLIAWTKDRNIRLVIDESFVDFADDIDASVLDSKLLADNPHLYVIKSISKSFGVPGLRLGILASGDANMIEFLKKDVAIWNINSFGEFYMQIAEKYKKDYVAALDQFRAERTRFMGALAGTDGLRVIPTQANFVMLEVTGGLTAKELTRRLIVKHNILIKNLVAKMQQDGKQYIRIAVKTTEENDRLVEALKEEMR